MVVHPNYIVFCMEEHFVYEERVEVFLTMLSILQPLSTHNHIQSLDLLGPHADVKFPRFDIDLIPQKIILQMELGFELNLQDKIPKVKVPKFVLKVFVSMKESY